jgi:hypothetical protein
MKFVDEIFAKKKSINFDDYSKINQGVSSEMFYNLMAVLHEKLPCS